MNNMMAYCGLVCEKCPIHLATFEKDKSIKHEKRVSIARFCREHYGMALKAEDITDCDGCRSDKERLFSGCRNCEIRKCAIGRNIESCAYCENYDCDELKKLFKLDPSAKTHLEEIRDIDKV